MNEQHKRTYAKPSLTKGPRLGTVVAGEKGSLPE
jgi:hypothetical protein